MGTGTKSLLMIAPLGRQENHVPSTGSVLGAGAGVAGVPPLARVVRPAL
jgi:hypothetical protein